MATRARLVTLPADTPQEIGVYRTFLTDAIAETGETVVTIEPGSQPAWMKDVSLPQVVRQKIDDLKVQLNGRLKWPQLPPLQRFALVKLTRGGHENANFPPALREFRLVA